MRPINQKERRSALLRFVGLFLLAIIPITFAVYQFARIDSDELVEARKKIDLAGEERKSSAEATQQLADIEKSIDDVTVVISKAVNNPVIDYSGEIQEKLLVLSSDLRKMSELENTKSTASMISYAQQMREEMSNLDMFVYKDLQGRLESLTEELDDSQRALADCMDRR